MIHVRTGPGLKNKPQFSLSLSTRKRAGGAQAFNSESASATGSRLISAEIRGLGESRSRPTAPQRFDQQDTGIQAAPQDIEVVALVR